MKTPDILIIGAGISGLLCATELKRAGRTVRVLDKGRGFGGRMATRRMGGGRLDHGAQFFTVRDPRFRAYVDEWLAAGVVREWFGGSEDPVNHHPRYCGRTGMTDAPKHLAADLDVVRSARATELCREQGTWVVQTDSAGVFRAKHLVVTAPLPQALQLLDTTGLNYAGDDLPALRAVRYEKGLATLCILDGPSGLPEPGGINPEDHPPLVWIADNRMKGISPDVTAVTLHADPEFSARHWDEPDDRRGPLMIEAARSLLRSRVVDYSCHRWGFTRPLNPWPEACYQNAGLKLTLAGDSFGGPKVEGAALSGIEAAHAIRCACSGVVE
ncbi:MAG: NAD(P)/FAD-dependent oxidoreductase [Opitutales bacterium]